MIARIIRASVDNRLFVLLAVGLLIAVGLYAVRHTPIDALPDVSDVQVIIKTSYPGQAPQVVEDQVTYPLTTAMLSVPGAVTVRGYSFFGDSYVYVIFDDDTDLYWARTRVLEYLSQVSPSLPANARPQLGPDATGVGWIYLYALVDRSGQPSISRNCAACRTGSSSTSCKPYPACRRGGHDWRHGQTVSGDPEPGQVARFRRDAGDGIQRAIQRANQEVGASVVEMAEAEYMVRASGYLQSDRRSWANVPLGVSEQWDAAVAEGRGRHSSWARRMRRGVAELEWRRRDGRRSGRDAFR